MQAVADELDVKPDDIFDFELWAYAYRMAVMRIRIEFCCFPDRCLTPRRLQLAESTESLFTLPGMF